MCTTSRSLMILMMVLVAMIGCTMGACQDTCVLNPEVTEGPYYVDLQLLRSDIREDKSGVPLYLQIVVVNSNDCAVVPNAGVEIWHCDAEGIYSHFEEASEGVSNPETDDTTYLRGIQVAGSAGSVNFTSIYPGWYEGRALHIHLKVHQGSTTGAVIHTGQLFFEEELNSAIEDTAPYSSETVSRVANANDNIYNNGGSYGLITNWALVDSSDISQGIQASITVEVDAATDADSASADTVSDDESSAALLATTSALIALALL